MDGQRIGCPTSRTAGTTCGPRPFTRPFKGRCVGGLHQRNAAVSSAVGHDRDGGPHLLLLGVVSAQVLSALWVLSLITSEQLTSDTEDLCQFRGD